MFSQPSSQISGPHNEQGHSWQAESPVWPMFSSSSLDGTASRRHATPKVLIFCYHHTHIQKPSRISRIENNQTHFYKMYSLLAVAAMYSKPDILWNLTPSVRQGFIVEMLLESSRNKVTADFVCLALSLQQNEAKVGPSWELELIKLLKNRRRRLNSIEATLKTFFISCSCRCRFLDLKLMPISQEQ